MFQLRFDSQAHRWSSGMSWSTTLRSIWPAGLACRVLWAFVQSASACLVIMIWFGYTRQIKYAQFHTCADLKHYISLHQIVIWVHRHHLIIIVQCNLSSAISLLRSVIIQELLLAKVEAGAAGDLQFSRSTPVYILNPQTMQIYNRNVRLIPLSFQGSGDDEWMASILSNKIKYDFQIKHNSIAINAVIEVLLLFS